MSQDSKTYSSAVYVVILLAVCIVLGGLIYYFNPSDTDVTFAEHDYSFVDGSGVSVGSSACGSSTSSASVNEKDMLATPISIPVWAGMDIKEMSVDMAESEYQNKDFPVVVCAGWRDGSEQAQISFSSSGVVRFSGDLSTTTVSGDSYQSKGAMEVNGTGTGQLMARVSPGKGSNSRDYQYSKALTVYFLAKENRLYASQGSFIVMRQKHIKWLRDSGKISNSEYKQRLKDLTMEKGKTEVNDL